MKLKLLVIFTSMLLLSACQNATDKKTITPDDTVIKEVENVPESAPESESITSEESGTGEQSSDLYYENLEYGFKFKLPKTWENFTVVIDEWTATSIEPTETDQDTISGVKLLIRHPKWTEEVKRQDIPIMVIPVDQWQLILEDKFHIGVAPIRPSELGRNDQYVFALPARYNFAFPTGFEEVETILEANPLEALKSK